MKLQPESFIDVDQCEVHINSDDLKCNWPTIINITTHDQYGDVVQVPDLKVSYIVLFFKKDEKI